jgi:hypothetical protein
MFSSYHVKQRPGNSTPPLSLAQLLGYVPSASNDVFLDKPGVLLLELRENPDTIFRPFPQKHAVMEVRKSGFAEFLERLVIATPSANSTNPAGLTDRLVPHLDAVNELRQAVVLDPFLHAAVLVFLITRETMT